MKKNHHIRIVLLITLTALILSVNTFSAHAQEDYREYNVTMNVGSNIINITTDKLFGYNQEWRTVDIRQLLLLDKNYSKTENFENDFENKEYYTTAVQQNDASYSPGATNTFKYISNADTWGGNVSYTRYAVKDGKELYANQYNPDGSLNRPSGVVDAMEDNKFKYADSDNLVTGGIDGYFGFGLYYELAKKLGTYDIEDQTVVHIGDNHAVKLSPARNVVYSGTASFFGKSRLALADRKTTLSADVYIDSSEADFRLGIIKDWNIERIKDIESNKYIAVNALQFAKEYNTYQEMGYLDIASFKNGKFSVNSEEIGEYATDKWYTVTCTLDFDDKKIIDVSLKDGDTVVCAKSEEIIPSSKNTARDISYISSITPSMFSFDERSDFGYMFSAHSGANKSVNTTVYIDNLKFITDKYYDAGNDVINPDFVDFISNHSFSYTRMAGTSANTFKWKEGLGNAADRKPILRQASSTATYKRREYFALPEWLKMIEKFNPEAEASYVINLHDSDEDIVDLIEFLTGDGDINGDGTDWSDIRRQNGIEHKARISMWEIGNEPDLNYSDIGTWEEKWTYDKYITRAKQIISILKKYSPDIKIALPADTDYTTKKQKGEITWAENILNSDTAKDIDYLSYHSYNPDRGSTISYAVEMLSKDIKNGKNTNIKIAYSEHGTNRPATRENYYQGIGLASALCEAQFFNRIFSTPIVETANLHSFSIYPGAWGIGYVNSEGNLSSGATMELMDMYAQNAVGDVLQSEIDGFGAEQQSGNGESGWDHENDKWKDGKYGYTCSAVRGEDGSLNLFISNSRNHRLNVELNLPIEYDDYVIKKKQTITGKNTEDKITSYDGYSYIKNESGEYELKYANDMVYTEEYKVDRDSVSLPPYSVTLIKLTDAKITSQFDIVSARYQNEQNIDLTGRVIGTYDSVNITLLVTDKKTGDIKYISQKQTSKNGAFNFNFRFTEDINNCTFAVNCGDKAEDITGKIISKTSQNELFDISSTSDGKKVTTTINNKYMLHNISFIPILGEYSSTMLTDVNIGPRMNLKPAETVIVQKYNGSNNKYKMFYWKDLTSIVPVFTPNEVK